MDVGRDRANGGGPESEGGDDGGEAVDLDLQGAIEDAKSGTARGDPEIAAFLDDEDAGGGASDVDAVFEEFEEGSVEEVMAADEDEDDEEELAEATDDDVKNLFGDLSAVELDPDDEAERDVADDGDDPVATAASAGTASSESGGVDGNASAPPRDPEETANEVEGLFDDLSGVDVPEESDPSTGTAETQATVLDTGADAEAAFVEDDTGGFQWLGEDVHIFSADEADVDGIFEEFEAGSVEDLIAPEAEDDVAGVGATAMYDGLATGRLPGATAGEGAPTASGWSTTGEVGADGRDAGDLYDALGVEAPAVVEEPGDETGDAEATGAGEAAETGTPTAADDAGDADAAAADDPAIDIDDLDPTEELDLELDDEAPGEPATADGPAEAPADEAGTGTAPSGADTTRDGDAGGAEASPTAPASTDVSVTDEGDLGDVTPDLDAAGGETPDIESESDVDAIFERFEESTPEEVIAAAEGEEGTEAGSVADETVERLFGDLSGVELETAEPAGPEESAAVPEPGSEAAETEVEGLLGDLSAVDVDVDADTGDEPATGVTAETTVGPSADPAEGMLERTGADTHVVVGESDVDAIFERFEEGSPEEIADSADADATAEADPSTADVFAVDDDGEELPGDDDAEDGDRAAGDGGVLSRIKGLFAGLLGR